MSSTSPWSPVHRLRSSRASSIPTVKEHGGFAPYTEYTNLKMPPSTNFRGTASPHVSLWQSSLASALCCLRNKLSTPGELPSAKNKSNVVSFRRSISLMCAKQSQCKADLMPSVVRSIGRSNSQSAPVPMSSLQASVINTSPDPWTRKPPLVSPMEKMASPVFCGSFVERRMCIPSESTDASIG